MTEREKELEQEVARLKRQMEFIEPIMNAYLGDKGKKTKDRMLNAEIVATVRTAIIEVMEVAEEVWLSPEDMCKQFSMFTPEWLRRHGELLPREKVRIVMEDGTVKESRSWAYPKHKINRLIRDGRLREIRQQ